MLIKGLLVLYLLLLLAWSSYFALKLGWEIKNWWRRVRMIKRRTKWR